MRYLSGMAMVLAMATMTLGQATTQPALPSGHPDVSKMQGQGGGMPAGHPAIPQGPGAGLPAGHPSVPQGPGGDNQALPSGHPDMSKLMAASTQPAGTGTLTVRALQGTKEGGAVMDEPVVVELYNQQGQVIGSAKGKLSLKGTATFNELPLEVPFQPLVRVMYKGVEFTGAGRPMDRMRRGQQIDLMVFETTEKEPTWTVKMRHVLVQSSADGLQVMEMMAVENPGDRAWISAAGADGKRSALSLPLPASAKGATLVGTPDGSTSMRDGKIVSSLPLMPGTSQVHLVYTVPVEAGKAELTIGAPAAIENLMVFVPDDGSTVTTAGLESQGVRKMGEGSTRSFKASGIKPGQEVKISFSGLAAPAKKAEGGPHSSAGESHAPQIIAGVGGGIILIGGATVLLIKSPKNGSKKS